jgi:hypothetical protein
MWTPETGKNTLALVDGSSRVVDTVTLEVREELASTQPGANSVGD